jgi:hypothetical protein
MERVEALYERANAELQTHIVRIDKELRPLQRAYFRCCFQCSDDSQPAASVTSCITACQTPLSDVQSSLGGAQQAFQNRVRRCNEIAREAVPTPASGRSGNDADAVAAYMAALEPCMRKEIEKLSNLMDPIHDSLPAALSAVTDSTPNSGKYDISQPVTGKKKGLLW